MKSFLICTTNRLSPNSRLQASRVFVHSDCNGTHFEQCDAGKLIIVSLAPRWLTSRRKITAVNRIKNTSRMRVQNKTGDHHVTTRSRLMIMWINSLCGGEEGRQSWNKNLEVLRRWLLRSYYTTFARIFVTDERERAVEQWRPAIMQREAFLQF